MSRGAAVRRGPGAKVLLGLIVLVAALVVAEFVTRTVIEHRVASLARQQMRGGSISVGLGATPALLDLVRGDVGTLRLHAENVRIGTMPDVSIDATLHHLSLSGDHQVDASDALVTVGRATLDQLASQAAGVPGISVAPQPASGTLDVSALSPGVVDVIAAPRLDGSRLTLEPRQVRVLGINLSGTALQRFVDRHPAAQSLSGLPLSLTPDSVRVTSSGLQVRFHGGPAHLTAASTESAAR